jgi:prepilin-type N-terminal cleavage/methylation domain-containing protein
MSRPSTSNDARRPDRPRRAMTLMEIMVVVGIFAVLAGITLPLMKPWASGRRVREAGRIVQAAVIGLRDRAIRDSDVRGLEFQDDHQTLHYVRYDAATSSWERIPGLAEVELPPSTRVEMDGWLASAAPHSTAPVLRFNGHGTAEAAGLYQIYLIETTEQGSDLNQRMAVVVLCQTGTVELYAYDNGVSNDLDTKIENGETVGR